MNYRDYYKHLDPIEIQLFEEGYWRFQQPNKTDAGLIFCTHRWTDMIFVLFKNNGNTIITMDQIKEYIDNPKKYKKVLTQRYIYYRKKKDRNFKDDK